MDAPPVQYVRTADGFDIAYTVEGNGPPFLWMTNHFTSLVSGSRLAGSRELIDLYASRFRVIRYDWRGKGLSQRGLGATHQQLDFLLDIDALVGRLCLEPFFLFALGLRAGPAVAYTAAHPERVKALILLQPVIFREAEQERNYRALSQLAALDWEFYLESMTRSIWPDHAVEARKAAIEALGQGDLLKIYGAADVDYECMLPEIHVPTLILTGGEGALVTEGTSRLMAAGIPNAQLRVLDEYQTPDPRVPSAIFEFADAILEKHAQSNSNLGEGAGTLSRRELEVLKLLADGKSNPQIAEELVISLNTVQHHVSNILNKTGLDNRTEAAAYAHRNNLV
jgi:DNA-binding CsgD family transcriptional regulator/pimeloyl-ACP methyl ester carboxylesterase